MVVQLVAQWFVGAAVAVLVVFVAVGAAVVPVDVVVLDLRH